jgi:hypothetical protein
MGEIEVVGMPPMDQDAARAIEDDFPDLFADVQNDPRTLTVMINPDDHHADVIHDMVVTDVIRTRYPGFSDEQVSDAATLFGIRSGLARVVNDEPEAVRTEDGPTEDPSPGADMGPRSAESEGPSGGDRFIRDTRRFIDVRDLQVDLLGSRREFDDAYELLSKALSEEVLRQLHGEVRAMKVTMTQEEAEKLLPRIREFISREGREPDLNSPNGREVRLADALVFLRRLSRQRRAEMSGADAGAAGKPGAASDA